IAISAGNSGVTNISGSGTSSVTFSGTIAELNALLNNSSGSGTGTIVYTGDANSPDVSTTLTLTIDDNGNNGGSALSGSASSTINLSPLSFGFSDWASDIDPFAPTT